MSKKGSVGPKERIKTSFDEVLAEQELGLTLSVPNRLQEESEAEVLVVKVCVSSMKDFTPASLIEQVPELKKLTELRDALMILNGPLSNVPAFLKAIDGVLTDDGSRGRVLGERGLKDAAEDA